MNDESLQKYSGLPKKIDIEGEKTRWHKFLEFINPFFKQKYEQGEALLDARLRQEIGKANQEEGKGRQEKLKALKMELKLKETLEQKELKELTLLKDYSLNENVDITKELENIRENVENLKLTKALEINVKAESLVDNSLKIQIKSSLNTEIEALNLNVRTYNALKKEGYNILRDLVIKTEIEILEIENISVSDLSNIVTEVNNFGLRFGIDVSDY